jgi:hypothetical protein
MLTVMGYGIYANYKQSKEEKWNLQH